MNKYSSVYFTVLCIVAVPCLGINVASGVSLK